MGETILGWYEGDGNTGKFGVRGGGGGDKSFGFRCLVFGPNEDEQFFSLVKFAKTKESDLRLRDDELFSSIGEDL